MVFTGTIIVITTNEPEITFEKFEKGDTVNVLEKLDFIVHLSLSGIKIFIDKILLEI